MDNFQFYIENSIMAHCGIAVMRNLRNFLILMGFIHNYTFILFKLYTFAFYLDENFKG